MVSDKIKPFLLPKAQPDSLLYWSVFPTAGDCQHPGKIHTDRLWNNTQ